MTTETITINKGFKTIQKTDSLDLYSAYNIVLGTSKQFRYSEVIADTKDNAAYFKKDLLICPTCGFRFGAYKHTIEGYTPQKAINRLNAYKWCCVPNLFDTSCKVLKLYDPFVPDNDIVCPNCSHIAPISAKTEEYIFTHDRHKLTVSTELKNIKDILDINWIAGLTVSIFPLTESVTFNFKKGKIHLKLTDGDRIICVRDITNTICNVSSKLISEIDGNSFIKGVLKRFFRIEWKSPLPYSSSELNFKRFCEMVTYIGYKKEFFSNIPYEYNKNKLSDFNKTFSNIRKSLHKYSRTPGIFSASSLPKTKALKRLMFNTPSLFFYIKEVEKLNIILGDINYLLKFMNGSNSHILLKFMHTYENIFVFYTDFARIKGSGTFVRYLMFHNDVFNRYGMTYLALSEKLRKKAQNEWKEKNSNLMDKLDATVTCFHNLNNCSESYYHEEKIEFKKNNICGYMFSLLRTKNDYIYYGTELDNCLGEFETFNPVICMNKNGHAVAAIEVNLHNMSVEQAYLKNNMPIEKNNFVYAAFKKWCRANNLQYEES